MPLNPLENMPASLARHKFSDEKFLENFNELKMNGRSKDWKTGMYMKFARSENLENADVPCHNSTSTYSIGNLFKQAKVFKPYHFIIIIIFMHIKKIG